MKNSQKRGFVLVMLGVVITITASSWWATHDADRAEIEAVKAVVETSYLNGAFNALDPDAMAAGFHEDFAIFSTDGSALGRYEIADWVAGVRERKSDPEFDPAKNKWDYKFAHVDVTGGAAQVKVELSRNGSLVYSDYLSLLKFEEEGWRIVAKVYHRHPR